MYADRIRELRIKAGIRQKDLGRMLGVSAVAVSKWERGMSQPDIETLSVLADFFGVSIDDLCDHQPSVTCHENRNATVMTRAFGRMTEDEQNKLLQVGRVLFAHAFEEEKP